MRTLVGIAFIMSAVTAPWWVTVPFGIALISKGVYGIVVLGGIIMDYLFGMPVEALGGFSFVYTALFASLAIISWYLHKHVLE